MWYITKCIFNLFWFLSYRNSRPPLGEHGYDNNHVDMQVTNDVCDYNYRTIVLYFMLSKLSNIYLHVFIYQVMHITFLSVKDFER